jgi:hypothetical protein
MYLETSGMRNQKEGYTIKTSEAEVAEFAVLEKGKEGCIPDEPKVVTSVPTTPKGEHRIVVGNTSNHIFWGVDAIYKRPKPEKTPRDEKLGTRLVSIDVYRAKTSVAANLQPHYDQVPKCDH